MRNLVLAIGLLLTLAHAAAGQSSSMTRPDGSEIVYHLSRPHAERYPLAVILQGSECLRVADKFGALVQQLNEAGIGVLRIEKPGLRADTPIGECPEEYLRLNTIDRRVLDLLAVLGRLRREDERWNGQLGLSGGSEGSMVAAIGAPLIPETTAVLLLSSGGGSEFGDEVKASIAGHMRSSGASEKQVEQHLAKVDAEWEEIARQPLPSREWASDGALARNTFLWWNNALALAVYRPLEEVSVPIRVYQGDADTSMVDGTGQGLLERHRQTGGDNLELVRYQGGHVPPPEVLREAFAWLASRLATP